MNITSPSMQPLLMRQRSIWNAFAFDFLQNGETIGGFEFPTFNQAQNARLQPHGKDSTKGDIPVVFGADRFRIIHTYTKRAYFNDVLFQLVHDGSGEELARLELQRVKGQRWPNLFFMRPGGDRCSLDIQGSMLTRRFELRADAPNASHAALGQIADVSSPFRARREILIDVNTFSIPQKAFLGVFATVFRP